MYKRQVLNKGLPELAKAAKENGVAVLAINNSHHMAAMWPETEKLAEEGLVAFACTSYKPSVAPAGAIKPLFVQTQYLLLGLDQEKLLLFTIWQLPQWQWVKFK